MVVELLVDALHRVLVEVVQQRTVVAMVDCVVDLSSRGISVSATYVEGSKHEVLVITRQYLIHMYIAIMYKYLMSPDVGESSTPFQAPTSSRTALPSL